MALPAAGARGPSRPRRSCRALLRLRGARSGGGGQGESYDPLGFLAPAVAASRLCLSESRRGARRGAVGGFRADTRSWEAVSTVVRARPRSLPAAAMLALISRLLDWFRSLFWKEEMELTLVGLQYSGKTTFVNVIAVSCRLREAWPPSRACHLPKGRAGRSCVCGPRRL